jgi:hypothetical protein
MFHVMMLCGVDKREKCVYDLFMEQISGNNISSQKRDGTMTNLKRYMMSMCQSIIIFIDYRLLLRLWDDTHNTHTLIFCTVVPIYFLCIHSHPLFQAEQQEWHSSTQTSQSQTQKSTSHLSRRVATKGEKVRCAPCVACGIDQLHRFSWIKTIWTHCIGSPCMRILSP